MITLTLTTEEAIVLEATFLEAMGGPPIDKDLTEVNTSIARKLAEATWLPYAAEGVD